MHELVVFIILLGVLSTLGVYMFMERDYIQEEESENV